MAENTLANLRDLLSSLRKTSASGDHFFIYNDLKERITRELVFDALVNSVPLYRRPQAVDIVLERGLRLFCILVWIQQEDHIVQFLEHNTLDQRLPIVLELELKGISPNINPRFHIDQWKFCPWYFDKFSTHMILQNNAILPFLDERKLAEGAGGDVSEVTVPEALQNLIDPEVRRLTMSYLSRALMLTVNG